MPWAFMIFTTLVLGAYVSYVKFVEEPAEERAAAALPVVAPLPPGASKRLPDGRLLMADGSIQRPTPS